MRARIEVKRIDLWSLFKISFFLYFVLGIIAGAFYALFVLVASRFQEAFFGDEFPQMGILGGVAGVLLIPVMGFFYGVIGSLVVTIGGMLYNAVAQLGGGVRVEADVDSEVTVAKAAGPLETGGGTAHTSTI